MDELLSLKWKNHCSTFIQNLIIIRKNQIYSDVTLACCGKFYSAHKIVLMACSDYFQDIFDHIDCKKPVIILNGIKSDDFEALLDYMYIGEVNVKQSDISSLMKAAEYLKIKGLAVPDDEPVKNAVASYKLENNSPNSKRKLCFHSSNFYAKQLKLDNSDSPIENRHFLDVEKNETNSYENQTINVKEEELDSFHENKVLQQDDFINENDDSNSNFLSQPSSSKIQNHNLEDSLSENNSTLKINTSNWPEVESSLTYSDYDNSDPSSQPSKKNIPYFKRCPYCWKEFMTTSILKTHLLTHTGEKPFSCNLCTYRSNYKNNLMKHKTRVHSQEKPFICHFCSFKTNTKNSLKRHMTSIHHTVLI